MRRSKKIENLLIRYHPNRKFINKYVYKKLKSEHLKLYIDNFYDEASLIEKKFYNIGAGSQRSEFDIWIYLDLESDSYSNEGIDLFYDLKSSTALPIADKNAEVIFSSFVL